MLSGSTLLRHLAQFYCAIYNWLNGDKRSFSGEIENNILKMLGYQDGTLRFDQVHHWSLEAYCRQSDPQERNRFMALWVFLMRNLTATQYLYVAQEPESPHAITEKLFRPVLYIQSPQDRQETTLDKNTPSTYSEIGEKAYWAIGGALNRHLYPYLQQQWEGIQIISPDAPFQWMQCTRKVQWIGVDEEDESTSKYSGSNKEHALLIIKSYYLNKATHAIEKKLPLGIQLPQVCIQLTAPKDELSKFKKELKAFWGDEQYAQTIEYSDYISTSEAIEKIEKIQEYNRTTSFRFTQHGRFVRLDDLDEYDFIQAIERKTTQNHGCSTNTSGKKHWLMSYLNRKMSATIEQINEDLHRLENMHTEADQLLWPEKQADNFELEPIAQHTEGTLKIEKLLQEKQKLLIKIRQYLDNDTAEFKTDLGHLRALTEPQNYSTDHTNQKVGDNIPIRTAQEALDIFNAHTISFKTQILTQQGRALNNDELIQTPVSEIQKISWQGDQWRPIYCSKNQFFSGIHLLVLHHVGDAMLSSVKQIPFAKQIIRQTYGSTGIPCTFIIGFNPKAYLADSLEQSSRPLDKFYEVAHEEMKRHLYVEAKLKDLVSNDYWNQLTHFKWVNQIIPLQLAEKNDEIRQIDIALEIVPTETQPDDEGSDLYEKLSLSTFVINLKQLPNILPIDFTRQDEQQIKYKRLRPYNAVN